MPESTRSADRDNLPTTTEHMACAGDVDQAACCGYGPEKVLPCLMSELPLCQQRRAGICHVPRAASWQNRRAQSGTNEGRDRCMGSTCCWRNHNARSVIATVTVRLRPQTDRPGTGSSHARLQRRSTQSAELYQQSCCKHVHCCACSGSLQKSTPDQAVGACELQGMPQGCAQHGRRRARA